MDIILTGAAGNIGRHVVEALGKDNEIHAVDKTSFQYDSGTAHQLDIVEDMGTMKTLIDRVRPDVLIHLAALVGGVCQQRPQEAHRLNTGATTYLAHLARECKIGHFLFASSAAVYAQSELLPTTERQNIGPENIYGKTKYAAERGIGEVALGAMHTQFTTSRIFNAYGHGFGKSLVERLRVSQVSDPVSLFSWHNFYRDYVHVSDIVHSIERAIDYRPEYIPHTVINIGSGYVRNNAMLIEDMENLGSAPVYKYQNEVDTYNYSWADINLARELLNFSPSTQLNLET